MGLYFKVQAIEFSRLCLGLKWRILKPKVLKPVGSKVFAKLWI
jgi:hypothetical protein